MYTLPNTYSGWEAKHREYLEDTLNGVWRQRMLVNTNQHIHELLL